MILYDSFGEAGGSRECAPDDKRRRRI